MADSVTKSMTLLPEYQEDAFKDLIANVFNVDEDGNITGIATENPMEGKLVYQLEGGGTTLDEAEALRDADGAALRAYEALEGGYTDDVAKAALDQYGAPLYGLEGGVDQAEVIGFTSAQMEALNRMTGSGEFSTENGGPGSMMDTWKPYFEQANAAYDSALEMTAASTGIYDPQGQIQYDTVTNADGTTSQVPRLDENGDPVRSGGYKDFYDPFVEDVVDASSVDFADALAAERNRINSEAAGIGAFGTRSDLQLGAAVGKSAAEEAKLNSSLRSAAYTGAQTQAQSAFENQQNRGLTAATTFQSLGTGLGAMGESAQNLGFTDVQTLFNTGALEQRQLQAESDVQRQNQLEAEYEPFARFSYMRDILSGVPASGTSLVATGTPQPSAASNIYTNSNVYGATGGGLTSIKNTSGA